MCSGGELLADFEAGTLERPEVPDIVGESLTTTADGTWVVWAHKMARLAGDHFVPLIGGAAYPPDAIATCRLYAHVDHDAPQPGCTCGFHALSEQWPSAPLTDAAPLEVMLSGRILAFEWPRGGVLFRAARQTVMRFDKSRPASVPFIPVAGPNWRPGDPDGRLAVRLGADPRGAGPVRRRLPQGRPEAVPVSEHVGYCADRLRRQSEPASR